MAKRKKNQGVAKRVWHVTEFRELFELPDDLRKDRPGPLSYTKSFVTLTGISREHEIKHFERLLDLKHRPERHLLRSIFEDIKNWSGKKTIRHRGFLLTTAEQPVSYDYLAVQLGLDVEELKRAMPILEEIGLLERVTMEKLPADGELTKTAKGKRKAIGTKRQKSKRRKNPDGKKGEVPDTSGFVRTNPAASGKKRTSPAASGINRTALYNGKRKGKLNGNDNRKGEIQKRQRRGGSDSNSMEQKSEIQPKSATTDCSRAAVTPPATPPLPTKSRDPARREHILEFPAPSIAVNNRQGPERLGQVIAGMEHRYHQDSREFGFDVYRALELRWDPRSVRGRRELGCFGSLWERAKVAGLPPAALAELYRRAILEAKKVARRKSRCSNVSAVWVFVFDRLLAASGVAARTDLGGCG